MLGRLHCVRPVSALATARARRFAVQTDMHITPVSGQSIVALCCAGSASFGAQRDFVLRWNADPTVKWRAPLGAGDLLVMRGDVQARRARVCAVRHALDFQHMSGPKTGGGLWMA